MKIALNIGSADRVIRVVVGCIMIWLAYSPMLTGGLAMAAYIAGAVAILTGIIRFCPAYTLIGIKTGSKES
jgi:hypothetical protein